MKKFEEFISMGIVKRQSPNRNRAISLIKEAEDKKAFLDLTLSKIPSEKMNANFVVNYCYDILMEFVRAKMFIEGFNSGNSHEAEVSYLQLLGFSEAEVEFMDELRYYRNGTKYYGTILVNSYAEKVLTFLNKNYSRIKNLVK
jgi:hypothetical protein